MSSFLDEEVPPVNPLSTAVIEELGRCVLQQLAPDMLMKPQPLNVLDLVDSRLPEFGIHVCPATREELGNRDGATDPNGNVEITILVSEDVWDGLESEAPKSHYAKTTVCHELGHALIHVPILRRRLLLNNVLARTQRSNLRPYEDPEWQAWTFAGSILLPRTTLDMLEKRYGRISVDLVSTTYEISPDMASNHLRRLKWQGFSAA
ncbi:MAG: ImmA/IrrE family metallo-endopeptidase [Nitrospirales bacterium]|nr:ImmA/IrrE family metallo-endopeptidase [Nitrospirales bacterium]